MKNKNHVITRNNVEQVVQKSIQSDVVIPNKLDNGETCRGLRHWRLLFNLKNNFSKPVRNDMECHPEGDSPKDLQTTLGSRFFNDVTTCPPLEGGPKSLISRRGKNVLNCNQEPLPEFVSDKNKLDCFAFARNDKMVKFEDNECKKILKRVQDDNTVVVQNDAKDKNVTNLFPYFPIFFSPKQLRRFRIKSGMTFIKQPAFTLAEGATHVDLPPTKAKLAFTLAEVLITLGIIGIVAAMTIPTLMTHLTHKKLQSQFEKTYADLNIAARMFYAQEECSVHDADVILYGGGTGLQHGSDKVMDKFMSYFKGVTKDSGSKWIVFDSANNITQLNLNGKPTTKYPCDQTSVSIDLAGRLYAMDDTSTSDEYNSPDYGPKLCVDINGIDKPNRLGFDRFVFVFTSTNSLVPYTGIDWARLTANETDENKIKKYCSYDLDSENPAHSCAYFALKDISPSGNGSYWTHFLK